ncbi:MAG TPA: hypothetical protein VE033_00165 [Acetobacteraceae bacterium]|nr:hypothetical protein [Acetobacteraceae bacterium]
MPNEDCLNVRLADYFQRRRGEAAEPSEEGVNGEEEVPSDEDRG